MIEKFFYFLKLFAGLLCWVCVAIASLGAILSGDIFFKVCGVISLISVTYKACMGIKESIHNNN